MTGKYQETILQVSLQKPRIQLGILASKRLLSLEGNASPRKH